MRPGLSGWAQVNYPYGASIEDTENKLSYDLYYLRNFSTFLDILILFKTIKIVFKASGSKSKSDEERIEMKNVAVVGLGFVGLTLSVVAAKKGYSVYGIDTNEKILKELGNSKAHFYEKDIDAAIQTVQGNSFILIKVLILLKK